MGLFDFFRKKDEKKGDPSDASANTFVATGSEHEHEETPDTIESENDGLFDVGSADGGSGGDGGGGDGGGA